MASRSVASLSTYVVMLGLSPILITPYTGDDTFNRVPTQFLTDPGATHFSVFLDVTREWMTQQGRFMPGAVALRDLVFTTFDSRETYKLFLFMVSLAVFVIIGLLVARITGRLVLLGPITAFLTMTWSLRLWADGIAAFHGVVPVAVLLSMLALWLVLSARRPWTVALATVVWSLALLTYEVAILLTPFMCIVVWFMRAESGVKTPMQVTRRFAVFIIPAAVDGLLVLWLRANMLAAPAPAYKVNLEPTAVAATYVRQFAAALPLSQYWYPGAAPLTFPFRLGALSVILVGVPIGLILILTAAHLRPPNVSWTALKALTVLGLGSWVVSATLVSVTLRWQQELPAGQAYLSVIWGYAGVSICTAVAWLALLKMACSGVPSRRWARGACHCLTVCIAVAAAFTFAANVSLASSLAGLPSA